MASLPSTGVKCPSLGPAQQRKVEAACLYIREHYQEPLNAKIVANAIGMSRTWLYRYFPSFTGQSLKRYIQHVRMERVAKLLLSSDLLVKQIARASGFQSTRTLRRTFVCHLGLPPHALRGQPRSSAPRRS